jgi:amino acid transporter
MCSFRLEVLTTLILGSLLGMHRPIQFFLAIFNPSQMSITLLGLIQLVRGRAATSLTTSLFDGTSTNPSAYALAFYSGLWAFGGWDQANYVGGEMSEPERNIPRVIHLSMITVTVRVYQQCR